MAGGVLLDMDGVIYHGSELIDGASELIHGRPRQISLARIVSI